jgi:DNA-binding MarR family transcriptional regulator
LLLAGPAAEAGSPDVRMGGIRLTELAGRAQLSLAAASELVNDLAGLGYLTRRSDPVDGRAKLIDFTPRGQALLADAGTRVADIEQRWGAAVGTPAFDAMCATMQRLLDDLDPDQARS